MDWYLPYDSSVQHARSDSDERLHGAGTKPDRHGLCDCDASEAARLAQFLGTLSRALGAVGKTVTLCVDEGGAGFLRLPYLQAYLETGQVERLMQMGTYVS